MCMLERVCAFHASRSPARVTPTPLTGHETDQPITRNSRSARLRCAPQVAALRAEVDALRQHNEELEASKRDLEALVDDIKACVCIDCMLETGLCPWGNCVD